MTAPRLEHALRRWERSRRRWEVDTTLVVFADSHGLAPIAESVRLSRQLRTPELRLRASRAVSRVLDALAVTHDPFDVRAWDAAAGTPARPRISA